MVPTPLESSGVTPQFPDSASGNIGGQMGTMSLGMLIQYINQRTYSDLLNMAEILPRKSDMEKKIDIVQYAQRTRQLYVRLLALVKWAASASKVDKCCHITGFLEKQNNLIIDTADKLFHMTKENLVNARLPHFHIPAAVETLTTGSYNRLPLTIRQRILPVEQISQSERILTLNKLEQIVQHRLLSSDLPPQMRTTKIENGSVRFTVDHEFEVSLTLMSDSATEIWRLLEVEIAVEDKETGEGKALVHPLQIGYIHQILQSRLHDHTNPLLEVYTVLHSFCQSLQLEVLYAQSLKLLRDRLDNHVRIEEYLQGRSLSLTYWRELSQRDSSSQLGYRLTVQLDPSNSSRPLVVVHTPSLPAKDCEVTEKAIRSDKLSIERLLVHTIYLRTKTRLFELKQELDERLGDSEKCTLSGSPAVLHVPILQPCFRSDQLLITVDTHSGTLLCHVPQYASFPRAAELQATLNGDRAKLDELISELRYWIMLRRTEKTLQHLDATAHERLPLMYGMNHPLHALGKHKVFVTFRRQPSYILIIEFFEKEKCECEVDHRLYLLLVKDASIEDDPNDDSIQTAVPRSYYRAYKLLPIEPFDCVFGPTTKIDLFDAVESWSGGKRKAPRNVDAASKRIKPPAYFLRDIAHIVAMCDHIYPLSHIVHQLEEEGVRTGGVEVEEGGLGVAVRLIDPPLKDASTAVSGAIMTHLLSAIIRTSITVKSNSNQQNKSNKLFIVEYLFTNCPVSSLCQREVGHRRPVYFTYEIQPREFSQNTIRSIMADWLSITKLYDLVLMLAKCFKQSNSEPNNAFNGGHVVGLFTSAANLKILSDIVKVRSFNYRNITLSYGPNHSAYITVAYDSDKKCFTSKFGMVGTGVWATNPHTLLSSQIEELINCKGSYGLISASFLLHYTYHPLLALSKLQPTLHPGAIDKCPHPVQIFSVVASSATRVHLFYRNIYCLEVDFLANGLVSIRDGAFSCFQMSKAIEEFAPIKGLKAFLNKYVDEGAICRRRSQSEDDNPPTPVPLDDSPWQAPKSASPARHGPITPPVSSNPHTPASPHPGGVPTSHSGFNSSPATAGGFSSPPSLHSLNPSPAGSLLPHSSPGYLGANSPSAGAHNVASPSPGFLPVTSPAGVHSHPSQSPALSFATGGSNSSAAAVSRMLPNKPFAASIPTILTHDAFHALCSPPQVPIEGRANVGRCCVLEQFLGSTCLLKGVQQYIRNVDSSNPMKDQNSCQIKLESMIASFTLESNPVYKLSMRLQPIPELQDRWTMEELQALETQFSGKASSAPYKVQAVEAMFRLLCFPYKLLKDCVRLIMLEMYPPGGQVPPLKWSFQWLLTGPALGKHLIPPGHNAVLNAKNKYLFYIQLSPAGVGGEADQPVLVLPVVHDVNTNKTQIAKRSDTVASEPSARIIQSMNELMSRALIQPHECSIYPCLREVLFNFALDSPSVVANQPMTPLPSQAPVSGIGGPNMGSHLAQIGGTPGGPAMHQANHGHFTPTGVPTGAGMGQGMPIPTGPSMGQGMGQMGMGLNAMGHGPMPAGMMHGSMGQGPRGPMQSNQGPIGGAPQSGFSNNMMGQFPR